MITEPVTMTLPHNEWREIIERLEEVDGSREGSSARKLWDQLPIVCIAGASREISG